MYQRSFQRDATDTRKKKVSRATAKQRRGRALWQDQAVDPTDHSRDDVSALWRAPEDFAPWSQIQVKSGLIFARLIFLVHFSSKNRNILLDKNWDVKISDFGWSRTNDGSVQNRAMTNTVGTCAVSSVPKQARNWLTALLWHSGWPRKSFAESNTRKRWTCGALAWFSGKW